MDVYITVDTEVWPRARAGSRPDLALDLAEDVYGITQEGEFGIGFQMDVLEAHRLRGVFFVESLFASAVGTGPLSRIVESIQHRGHEVQLHIHPEWLNLGAGTVLSERSGKNLKDYSLDAQCVLIAKGLENLRASGVENVGAFRAGNCAANFDTLRALHRLGIPRDSSYNIYYLDTDCGLRTERPLLQPSVLEGVQEFPITFFQDWPGHYRHVQLAACSSTEMQAALLGAHARGWKSFVLISHSFEMLKGRHTPNATIRPDYRVVGRFRELCEFLGKNRSKFRTAVFSEAAPVSAVDWQDGSRHPLSSNMARTGWRYVEQLSRRLS
jgi:hypothetical protein